MRKILSISGEFLDAVVAAVSDVEISGGVDGDADMIRKLAVATTSCAEL